MFIPPLYGNLDEWFTVRRSACQEFNVAVVLSNQVMADPGGGCAFMPSFPKPVGNSLSGEVQNGRMAFCHVFNMQLMDDLG